MVGKKRVRAKPRKAIEVPGKHIMVKAGQTRLPMVSLKGIWKITEIRLAMAAIMREYHRTKYQMRILAKREGATSNGR